MDWLEWLENSEDSSLISSCRLWTRREARCLYSWCIADSSSLIRGTCKNTTHHVIPGSWAAQLLGSQSTPEQNAVTVLPAPQSPAFTRIICTRKQFNVWKMHTFNIGSFQWEQENSEGNFQGLNEATQSHTLFREWNILSSTLAFPTKCVICCIKVCNSQISIIPSLPLNKNAEEFYRSEKITWLYAVKKTPSI